MSFPNKKNCDPLDAPLLVTLIGVTSLVPINSNTSNDTQSVH